MQQQHTAKQCGAAKWLGSVAVCCCSHLIRDIKQTLFNFTIDCSQLIEFDIWRLRWIYSAFRLPVYFTNSQYVCLVFFSWICCAQPRQKEHKNEKQPSTILNYINSIAINRAFGVETSGTSELVIRTVQTASACDEMRSDKYAFLSTNTLQPMCLAARNGTKYTLRTRRAIISRTNGIWLCAEQMLSITAIYPIQFISHRKHAQRNAYEVSMRSNSVVAVYGLFLLAVPQSVPLVCRRIQRESE